MVSLRVPQAVVGLLSALRFHELTTESPHEVRILMPRGARRPQLDHPPLRVSWTTPALLSEGIERHAVDGVEVRVTSPAGDAPLRGGDVVSLAGWREFLRPQWKLADRRVVVTVRGDVAPRATSCHRPRMLRTQRM